MIDLAKELNAEGAELVMPFGGRVFPAIGIQFTEMRVGCRRRHSPIAYPCRIQFSPEDVTKKIFT